MARDASLFVRRAVIETLKADPGFAAIAGVRMYGPNPPAEPTFPFGRYGLPTTIPFRATGLDGCKIAITLHAFAKGSDDGVVHPLASAMASALEGVTLDLLPHGCPFAARLAHITWDGTTAIEDAGVKTGWHAIVRMTATVVS